VKIDLRPIAGESEFADPGHTGDWAGPLAQMLGEEQRAPWCSYAARRNGALVGLGGFKGPPDNRQQVEIGYLTFLSMRGQGVAGAVAEGLLEIAQAEGVAAVIAHTMPEENASTAVLRRHHFDMVGEVVDPEDGAVWRWTRKLR
jgi:ribosomal-protein-alanine N-acetyltransferase